MSTTLREMIAALDTAAGFLKSATASDPYISQADFALLQEKLEGEQKRLVELIYQVLRDREMTNGRITRSDVDAVLTEIRNDFLLNFEIANGPLSTSETDRFGRLGDSYVALAQQLKTITPGVNYDALAKELELLAKGLTFGEAHAPAGHEPFIGFFAPVGIAEIGRANFLPAISQLERFKAYDTLYQNVRSGTVAQFMAEEFVPAQSVELQPQAEELIKTFRMGLDRHVIVTVEEHSPDSGYPTFWFGFTPEDHWVGLMALSYWR